METEFTSQGELILFLPKSQYLWHYSIDDGKQHSIHQDNLFKYIETLVSLREIPKLVDIVRRHQAFIVFVKEKKIQELTKETLTDDYYRENIQKEMNNAMNFQNKVSKGFENFDKSFYKILSKNIT